MDPTKLPPAGQALATAIILPVMMGDCFQILLYGVALAISAHHVTTPSWKRSKLLVKVIIVLVLLLNAFITAIDIYDIGYYSTRQRRDIIIVLGGTTPTCLKPALVGLIGILVQSVLVARTSKAISHKLSRLGYLVLMGCMISLEFFASAATTAWSFRFHFSNSQGPWWIFDFSTGICIWMWTACVLDLSITSIYLIVIWSNLRNETGELVDNMIKIIFKMSIRSAAYTAFLALTTAIVTQAVRQKSMMTELVPYAFWNPLPALYALSLFTTLSIADKAVESTGHSWASPSSKFSGWSSRGETSGCEAGHPVVLELAHTRSEDKGKKAYEASPV